MTSQVQHSLDRITRVHGVRGALVVTAGDGLIVADTVMDSIRREAVAALAASLAVRMARACQVAGVGREQFIHLQCVEGTLLAMPASEDVVVVVVGDRNVNVGLVRLEMQQAAEMMR
jgi:predicted regulator of Ras-like GTPase activity (Roadblock/LC7/MglB family)